MNEEINDLKNKVAQVSKRAADFKEQAVKVIKACHEVDKSWSMSSLVGHAKYFYRDFDEPPSTQRFSIEWGLLHGVPAGWQEKNDDEVVAKIEGESGVSLEKMRDFAEKLEEDFLGAQRKLVMALGKAGVSEVSKVEEFTPKSATSYFNDLFSTSFMTRDTASMTGHYIVPHIYYEAMAKYIKNLPTEIKSFIFEVEKLTSGISENEEEKEEEKEERDIDDKETYYVENSIILSLSRLQAEEYDLTRLIRMCKELNDNYSLENYLACAMLIRAILDHVPPIFGKKNFSEVANNHGNKSFRDLVLPLDNTSRKIADLYLHTQIRKKEALPTKTQVSSQASMDILLSEVIRILKE